MSNDPFEHITLGQHQPYVDQYDPHLLQAVPRALARERLSLVAPHGCDVWTGYELSWLDLDGRPRVVVAEFTVPASSAAIVESKSFKYYLNSFNQTRLASSDELQERLQRDLSTVVGEQVTVCLYSLVAFAERRLRRGIAAHCIDQAPFTERGSAPDKALLMIDSDVELFDGVWVSHLFKSNCPVTGQPDWASIWLGWRGPALSETSLLAYLVSFRQHQDFHEHCVERIYADLYSLLQPESLWVYARYTRRGGLDINPFRSLLPGAPPEVCAARQ